MMRHLPFAAIVLFWLTMNALLWRSEFGGGKELGSVVPAEMVWQKILTAPDNSDLEVIYRGQKIGYVRWMPNVGEELATGKTGSEDLPPEGMVKKLSGYSMDVDGTVLVAESSNRWRGHLHLDFGTNQNWRALSLTLTSRLGIWTLHASAREKTLSVQFDQEGLKWDRNFTFAELENPASVLAEFGVPWLQGWLNAQGAMPPRQLSLGLTWQARNDTCQFGHSQVRVYRLKARLFDRYEASLVVSRVGEILRLELPHDLVLKNDILLAW